MVLKEGRRREEGSDPAQRQYPPPFLPLLWVQTKQLPVTKGQRAPACLGTMDAGNGS